MSIGIHIFRRDFRIEDNPALSMLLKKVDKIIGIFIIDVNQPTQNEMKNVHSLKFMYDALYEFNKSVLLGKLCIFKGDVCKVIKMICDKIKIVAVSLNLDYSEYSIKRDALILEMLDKLKIESVTYKYEMLLNDPKEYVKSDGKAYTVFGAYKKNVDKNRLDCRRPFKRVDVSKFIKIKCDAIPTVSSTFYTNRKYVLSRVSEQATEKARIYELTRKEVDREQLCIAAHLKYGIVSGAEMLRLLRSRDDRYIDALHYRNHYFLIRIFNGNNGYGHMDRFFGEKVKWPNSYVKYKRMWVTCDTGYPVIDACVRKLKSTGWINNRACLLLSFFSIKILHIDPFDAKYGGQVEFSKYLVYSCYANNWCNWNFALGVLDQGAQRYGMAGRYYSTTNIRKWDPSLNTIRKYIPELDSCTDEEVFNWHTFPQANKRYPVPMVNDREEFEKYKRMVKK